MSRRTSPRGTKQPVSFSSSPATVGGVVQTFLVHPQRNLFLWILFGIVLVVWIMVFTNESLDSNLRTKEKMEPWKPGYLDIHHLQVGSSVSSFVILPDGTTIVIDAGEVDVDRQLAKWAQKGPPFDTLQLKRPFPDSSKSCVEWIVDYIHHFWPYPNVSKESRTLDYVLMTHFHADHFGQGLQTQEELESNVGPKYTMSGIPELAKHFSIETLIDRDYPYYNNTYIQLHPDNPDILNYRAFVQDFQDKIQFQQFQVGSRTQIRMKTNPDPNFSIQVLKSSLDVWSNEESKIIRLSDPKRKAIMNENLMSAAFVFQYGSFRYYEGADQEIAWNKKGDAVLLDTIGPTAKTAGKVDIATLNHHGHGMTQDYFTFLDPSIMILKGWCSDQPPKKSMDIVMKNEPEKRSILATDIFEEHLQELGPAIANLFQSKSGHIVVRVYPPPNPSKSRKEPQVYEIFILDADRTIKAHHGPFRARGDAS